LVVPLGGEDVVEKEEEVQVEMVGAAEVLDQRLGSAGGLPGLGCPLLKTFSQDEEEVVVMVEEAEQP